MVKRVPHLIQTLYGFSLQMTRPWTHSLFYHSQLNTTQSNFIYWY